MRVVSIFSSNSRQESGWTYLSNKMSNYCRKASWETGVNLKCLCFYHSQVLYSSWVPWCKTAHRSHPQCSTGPRTAVGKERTHVSTWEVNWKRKSSLYIWIFLLETCFDQGKLGHRVTIISSWAFCRSSTIKAPHTDNTTIQQSELTLIHTQFVTHTLIDHRLSSHPHKHGQSTCCNALICICACVQYNPVNHMKLHNSFKKQPKCKVALQ